MHMHLTMLRCPGYDVPVRLEHNGFLSLAVAFHVRVVDRLGRVGLGGDCASLSFTGLGSSTSRYF